jgi:hypothetical protein
MKRKSSSKTTNITLRIENTAALMYGKSVRSGDIQKMTELKLLSSGHIKIDPNMSF